MRRATDAETVDARRAMNDADARAMQSRVLVHPGRAVGRDCAVIVCAR